MPVPYNQTDREPGDDRGKYYCKTCSGYSTRCYRCDVLLETSAGGTRRCGADLTKQSTTTRGQRFDASV